MSLHIELIGTHPVAPNIFERWLECNDIEPTDTRCHRSLRNKIPVTDSGLITWLAEKLIYHHYDEERLDKLKIKYAEVGFPEYAEQHRKLPKFDKTKKGNATEILLIEYIESCQNKPLIKAFKLRYNPNVDQAIKGDDTLMVDIVKDEDDIDQLKVFLGEAKFRKTPTKTVVDTISNSLGKDKLPLSFSFLIDELNRSSETKPIADLLDKFLIKEIKAKGNICYTGFLLSDSDTFKVVDTNLHSDNPAFILISAGIDSPEDLVNEAFKKAEELIANPTTL